MGEEYCVQSGQTKVCGRRINMMSGMSKKEHGSRETSVAQEAALSQMD